MTGNSSSRIPLGLQAVFLASNRGNDVNKPPPEQAAFKVFRGNWLFQRKSASASKLRELCRRMKTAPAMKQRIGPQVFLDLALRSRGYSSLRYKTLRTAYYSKPTPLQQASYDSYLIGLVRTNNVEKFREVVASGLISSNPCNAYGESLVHMVCRTGRAELLQILLTAGCSIQISDDYGRNPLHDACWAAQPAFDVVKLILQYDVRLFHMMDCRGHIPLTYVREEHWGAWMDFLKANLDVYWPQVEDGSTKQGPPPLTREKINTRPLADPEHALPLDMARLVASGNMKVYEAAMQHNGSSWEDSTAAGMTVAETTYYSCDSDGSDSDSCFSDSTFDEDEMEVLLTDLPSLRNVHNMCAGSY